MWIYNKISKLIPESKFKNRLRNLFYKIIYSATGGNRIIILDKKNNISGKFKRLLLINQGICLEEIEGYLKDYNPKKGDVVIDAGAFHGHFAVLASKLVGDEGKVIALEPEENNYNLLKKNIELNNLKNVILLKKGLWNKDTVLKFRCHGPDSKLADFEENKEAIYKSIEVIKLDTIIKNFNIKKVDFIKMDIEGAELNAVEGAKEIMKKNKINFAIASYHEVDNEKTSIKLEKFFKKNGYKTHSGYPLHPTTYAYKN